MLELLRLAHERKARVILSGDTRQHGAVQASDALLVIERHSGVRPVELAANEVESEVWLHGVRYQCSGRREGRW